MGLAAGFVGGLLGIGGGTLIVPGLVFLLNFNQHKAHGTSLAAVLLVSMASALTYSRHGHVEWRLAGIMAAGGVVGAWLGASVAAHVRSAALRRVFCVFLFLIGVRMIAGGCLGEQNHNHTHAELARLFSTTAGMAACIGTGLFSGFVSGLLGIGGGIIAVPAMVLLLCVGQHTAQGVSLAAIIPTVLTGMLMHHDKGHVEFRVAKWIGFGAIGGGIAGASLAGYMDPSSLKVIFGGFLFVMSVLMALKK